MKILIDSHHQGLTESLHLLLADRLGHDLYIQLGMDWYTSGYWKIQPFEATAIQFLQPNSQPYPEFPPVHFDIKREAGVRYVVDQGKRVLKGLEFERFKQMQFDVIIASVPQHIEPFLELIKLYQPQAKLIFQIGNAWSVEAVAAKNILASARVGDIPTSINFLSYHQEFDLSVFKFTPVQHTKKIYSFINCLNTIDLYRPDWELFQTLERLLPEYEFRSFGGQCRDGYCTGPEEVASRMAEAEYIFMCKTQGDGYGHNIFSAAAMGRPLITRSTDYIGKLAEPLIDPFTSLLVDHASPETIAQLIRTSWNDDALTPIKRGENIYAKFKAEVDFEVEAERVKQFLDHLQ